MRRASSRKLARQRSYCRTSRRSRPKTPSSRSTWAAYIPRSAWSRISASVAASRPSRRASGAGARLRTGSGRPGRGEVPAPSPAARSARSGRDPRIVHVARGPFAGEHPGRPREVPVVLLHLLGGERVQALERVEEVDLLAAERRAQDVPGAARSPGATTTCRSAARRRRRSPGARLPTPVDIPEVGSRVASV